MVRLPIDKARLQRLGSRAAVRYIEFVHRRSRVVTEPDDTPAHFKAHQPCIVAFWHGQFLMVPALAPRDIPFRVMVARHADAEILAQALPAFAMQVIRGAGAGARRRDRGGTHALREAVRALAEGYCVSMTADVPPGPARRCGLGIVMLARLSGRPIIPVAAATTRYHSLDTWSRMTINLPFGTLAAVAGNPIRVARTVDEAAAEAARLAVETELDRVTARAYQLAGADPARATPRRQLATAGPMKPGWILEGYRAAANCAALAAPIVLRYRERRGKEDGRRRGERLGQATVPRPEGTLVWVHAASVGETNLVLPLLDSVRRARPAVRFLLTTMTVTSAALAQQRLSPGDVHQYVPLDAPRFVRRFVDHWQPQLAVFAESEIWPNLILETAARGVPLALVNARLSNKSYARWRRNRGVSGPLFSRFDIVLAQNEKLARRFREVGARNAEPAGNLKIDAPPPPIDTAAFERLKHALDGRPVLIAASTHDGEDQIVAAAHRHLAHRLDGLCSIIVPRHPQRGTAVAELLTRFGLSVRQRSLGELPEPACEVYVADTIGELGTFYALAPVAFIGGSLVAHGGQNPVEAVRRGAAVLTGPHWQNFQDAYRTLLRHEGAVEVHDANELAAAALKVLNDAAELERMRRNADAALATMSGALQRTTDALLALLPNEVR